MILPEMHFRYGVDMRFMSPQILYAWICAAQACDAYKVPCVASSIYRDGSLHATGNAIDISMRDVPVSVGDAIHARLSSWIGRLGGGQFDVVNELRPGSSPGWTGPHIHIEFDPKEK